MVAKVYIVYFLLFFLCIFYGAAECTAAEAFKHAGDNIVFASGSPFENVDLGNFLFSTINSGFSYDLLFSLSV